MAWLKP